ncbi:MAG: LysE family transporter [Deltaproteobacteria bacterium]|nr:LysE family transporter [Deltaproteobacteria bacterium]
MTALFTIFFTSFLIAFSGAMMPGPLLTITISESSRRGAVAGPLLIAGHAILELALVIALLFGLAPFLLKKSVFVIIALAGSAMLLWMAFSMVRALPGLSLQVSDDKTGRNNLLITGILMSLANPYWIIWWVSIGLAYIMQSLRFGKWGVFFFFTGHILADFIWYAFISMAVWKGKSFLNDRTYRYLMAGCAVLLFFFSGFFAYSGFIKLAA